MLKPVTRINQDEAFPDTAHPVVRPAPRQVHATDTGTETTVTNTQGSRISGLPWCPTLPVKSEPQTTASKKTQGLSMLNTKSNKPSFQSGGHCLDPALSPMLGIVTTEIDLSKQQALTTDLSKQQDLTTDLS